MISDLKLKQLETLVSFWSLHLRNCRDERVQRRKRLYEVRYFQIYSEPIFTDQIYDKNNKITRICEKLKLNFSIKQNKKSSRKNDKKRSKHLSRLILHFRMLYEVLKNKDKNTWISDKLKY